VAWQLADDILTASETVQSGDPGTDLHEAC
jgi:hypothetical protein